MIMADGAAPILLLLAERSGLPARLADATVNR